MCAGNELFFSMLYLLNFYEDTSGLLRMILYASTPIFILKSAISGVHLVTAAKNMGRADVAEREQNRKLKSN